MKFDPAPKIDRHFFSKGGGGGGGGRGHTGDCINGVAL